MTLSYIDNHTEMANSRLVQQDKESYNTVNFLNAIIDPVQEIEDSFQDISYKRSLETAQGVNLDNFGLIVGEARDFRKDEDFRIGILTRIIVNMGGGTVEEIITAITLLYRPKQIEVTNLYPACFSIFIEEDVQNLLGIKRIINSIRPVAIGDFVITANVSDYGLFEFSECSSELMNFETSGDQVLVRESSSSYDFAVQANTLLEPRGSVGLSELSLNRYGLLVNQENNYVVTAATELSMITSHTDDDDYTVYWDGGELTEVINE